MNPQELKQRYEELYNYMATSQDPDNMKTFGNVMTEMMDWMIANKPDAAAEWIEKLEHIKWNNYLTPKEAEKIVGKMDPQRPWSREQWMQTMQQHGLPLEEEPHYNRCALYVTMSMIYSDSLEAIKKYIKPDADIFEFIHALAVSKLKDKDKGYSVREYFKV